MSIRGIINLVVWVLDADWLKQPFSCVYIRQYTAGMTQKYLFTVLLMLVTSL